MPQCVAPRMSRHQTGSRAPDIGALTFATELGWVSLAQHEEVLVGVVFGYSSRHRATRSLRQCLARGAATPRVDELQIDQQPPAIIGVVERLMAYAAGDVVDFRDVRIDEHHLTDFGRRVVKACRRIPHGRTHSYGELAAVCDSPGAARAVGQVMARNRYPLIVPCHRVLATGGLLGGFSAPQGLAMKRRLLELESQTRSAR